MSMKPELKSEWLAALRSGEYEQGIERLKKNEKYCCLGVLCDISKRGEWSVEDDYYILGLTTMHTDLCGGFKEEVGLPDEEEERLINMNDGGKSFTEIAKYIEEYL